MVPEDSVLVKLLPREVLEGTALKDDERACGPDGVNKLEEAEEPPPPLEFPAGDDNTEFAFDEFGASLANLVSRASLIGLASFRRLNPDA